MQEALPAWLCNMGNVRSTDLASSSYAPGRFGLYALIIHKVRQTQRNKQNRANNRSVGTTSWSRNARERTRPERPRERCSSCALRTSFARPATKHTEYNTHIDDRKLLQDSPELLVERVLGELDLAHVKVADPADLEVLVDDLQRRVSTRWPRSSRREDGQ